MAHAIAIRDSAMFNELLLRSSCNSLNANEYSAKATDLTRPLSLCE